MDLINFLKENTESYNIYTLEKENWQNLAKDLCSLLDLGRFNKDMSLDYFLYGGITILSFSSDKIVMTSKNFNKKTSDFIESRLKEYNIKKL